VYSYRNLACCDLRFALHCLQSSYLLEIVAAGPGEGGEGGGGSIEVGVADKSAILGFAKPQPVAYVAIAMSHNNTRVESVRKPRSEFRSTSSSDGESRPRSQIAQTDRPVVSQQERYSLAKTNAEDRRLRLRKWVEASARRRCRLDRRGWNRLWWRVWRRHRFTGRLGVRSTHSRHPRSKLHSARDRLGRDTIRNHPDSYSSRREEFSRFQVGASHRHT